ncbi:hypothetical protein BVRB_6g142610 [Beta vulgaris subsp. vulgaris]|nr:hypothetical protein BVRB_6g142610 [Beta vulgaris subsp. vulgaris]
MFVLLKPTFSLPLFPARLAPMLPPQNAPLPMLFYIPQLRQTA